MQQIETRLLGRRRYDKDEMIGRLVLIRGTPLSSYISPSPYLLCSDASLFNNPHMYSVCRAFSRMVVHRKDSSSSSLSGSALRPDLDNT